MKQETKQKINRILSLFSASGLIFSLSKGFKYFYQGLHNLDLAFNFLNLGYKVDFTASGTNVALLNGYMAGIDQVKYSMRWFIASGILCLVLGYFLRNK